MAKIIGQHEDGGEAAAYANKLQVTVIHWDGEPTAEQLKQYPNSTWCSVGKQTLKTYGYNDDENAQPIRKTSIQWHWLDTIIMAGAVLGFIIAVLFLFGLSRL